MSMRHRIDIEWSDEDGAYVATVPALDGCSALGVTPLEALAELLVVAQAWEEVLEGRSDLAAETG